MTLTTFGIVALMVISTAVIWIAAWTILEDIKENHAVSQCDLTDIKVYVKYISERLGELEERIGKKVDETELTNRCIYENIHHIQKIVERLNEHHFDYRELIEKGLAVEVKGQQESESPFKDGEKVVIHCREERNQKYFKEIFNGKEGTVIGVWSLKGNPWGNIAVQLDEGKFQNCFFEDELTKVSNYVQD